MDNVLGVDIGNGCGTVTGEAEAIADGVEAGEDICNLCLEFVKLCVQSLDLKEIRGHWDNGIAWDEVVIGGGGWGGEFGTRTGNGLLRFGNWCGGWEG